LVLTFRSTSKNDIFPKWFYFYPWLIYNMVQYCMSWSDFCTEHSTWIWILNQPFSPSFLPLNTQIWLVEDHIVKGPCFYPLNTNWCRFYASNFCVTNRKKQLILKTWYLINVCLIRVNAQAKFPLSTGFWGFDVS